MKGIFERNGFTRMEELNGDKPPMLIALDVSPPVGHVATIAADPVIAIERWTFRLQSIQYVDGERIAFYEYAS